MAYSLLKRFHPNLPKEETLLLACSGGGDSVALACLLHEAGYPKLTLCHLDHGWREGSAAEADFVRALAEDLRADFLSAKLELPGKGNREAESREARYRFLRKAAEERGIRFVLTGHHGEDRAESLWLWFLRGSGFRGLATLPGSRKLSEKVTLHRPLLPFKRDELRDYLRESGRSWLEDPANEDIALRRNLLRRRILPFLQEETGVDPLKPAQRTARQAERIVRFLDAELEAGRGPKIRSLGKGRVLDRRTLASAPEALSAWLLARELGELGESSDEAIERLLESNRSDFTGRTLELPGKLEAKFTADEIFLACEPEAAIPLGELPEEGLKVPREGSLELGNWKLHVREEAGRAELPGDHLSLVLDSGNLSWPLRLMNPLPQMKVQPLGFHGHRKLSDFLMDRKLARELRSRTIVLLDAEDRLLWVSGLGRSEKSSVNEETKSSLCLDWKPASP
ncbi:MAG: tRNA lysidine(34) synthetase TilS [Candidatus Krumholzibacteria bacterium]|jgi:tRNA(Ile)-lysidine synthase|nr:tRNA lysidine(34) synthetase TilS [Candidatus Krumholzibacteria bacterium]MDP7021775.1 tRNA lysidine(34) synthetase TilS [Candidatus Krumholzibacteria bacterium]